MSSKIFAFWGETRGLNWVENQGLQMRLGGGRMPSPVAKYLYRTCPKCKDYLGVVVPEPPEPVDEIPIDAHCAVCGFKLAWKVVIGQKTFRRNAYAKADPSIVDRFPS